MKVTAREGSPLRSEWTVREDQRVWWNRRGAGSGPESRAGLWNSCGSSSGDWANTAYELAELELGGGRLAVRPSSLLNQMRREAVEALQARQGDAEVEPTRPSCRELQPALLAGQIRACPNSSTSWFEPPNNWMPPSPSDRLPSRSITWICTACGLPSSVCDAGGIASAGCQPASAQARGSANRRFPCELRLPDPGALHRTAARAPREAITRTLIGDFSLNAANSLSAQELLRLGIDVLTPTHDLNAAQVAELARQVGADSIEVVAYQHLPVFHTEHCVFCRFLSTGTSYRDCGRPCEKHRVALRDSMGRAHPVLADVGCRNTVFGAEAQQASQHMEEWRAAGIHQFRLEFAHESAEQTERVARAFDDMLAGRKSARDLAQELSRVAPEGITQGSLFVPEGYLTLPVLQ